MEITLTNKCDIKSPDRLLREKISITQAYCKEVLDLLIHIVEQEWGTISQLSRAQERQRAVEVLINATKKNPTPKYPRLQAILRPHTRLPASCPHHESNQHSEPVESEHKIMGRGRKARQETTTLVSPRRQPHFLS